MSRKKRWLIVKIPCDSLEKSTFILNPNPDIMNSGYLEDASKQRVQRIQWYEDQQCPSSYQDGADEDNGRDEDVLSGAGVEIVEMETDEPLDDAPDKANTSMHHVDISPADRPPDHATNRGNASMNISLGQPVGEEVSEAQEPETTQFSPDEPPEDAADGVNALTDFSTNEPVGEEVSEAQELETTQFNPDNAPDRINASMDFSTNEPVGDVPHVHEPETHPGEIPGNLPNDQQVQYIVVANGTQRGKMRLHDSLGFMYTRKRQTKNGAYWTCSVRSTYGKCHATVQQKGSEFVPGRNPHIHPARVGSLIKTKVRAEVKRRANEYMGRSGKVIAKEIIQQLREEGDYALPNLANEARWINRHRASKRPAEPVELDFELDWEGCGIPGNFIRADIKMAGARHIILASDEQLNLLVDAKSWYLDRTDKVVKKPFSQLLSVHAFIRSGYEIEQVPMAFILMSRGSQQDYVQVFKTLKDSLPCPPDVEECVVDFETALWQAVKDEFPEVHIHGCTFRWVQTVHRRMCSLGLQKAYCEKSPVYDIAKQLFSLPYLPRRHIPGTLEELKVQCQTSGFEALIELCHYIQVTWMHSTMWAVGNWSGYRRLIRTHGDCEGWYRRLNTRRGTENTPVYKLLELLKKEADLVNSLLVMDEQTITQRQKEPKNRQEKLNSLWTDYEEKRISIADLLKECTKLVPF